MGEVETGIADREDVTSQLFWRQVAVSVVVIGSPSAQPPSAITM